MQHELIIEPTLEYAQHKDREDHLSRYRSRFYFPRKDQRDVIYFCGNSLGLQPRQTAEYMQQELKDWQDLAIGGYLQARNPWMTYPQALRPSLARIVGCLEEEVTVMNALTVNLHLLLMTFYRPSSSSTPPIADSGHSQPGSSPRIASAAPDSAHRSVSPRYKILMEAGAFPSDQYAVETQVKWHGYTTRDAIIEIGPREGEKTIREEDILQAIDKNKDTLALVLLGGINYYTGQLFDMAAITKAAHQAGALVGYDLAHAVGNVPLHLHDWDVDFAVWCSYKYLNGGPGAAGGAFVHERFARNKELIRLGGWWGNDEDSRFRMEKGFIPKPTAEGWSMSTAQVFNMVSLKASLAIFDEAGIQHLQAKSRDLTAYLQHLLETLDNIHFEILTPTEPHRRGAQLSLYFGSQGKAIHQQLIDAGVVVDYREPGVVRVAPAPLYNSFEDVYHFYHILQQFQ